MSHNVHTPIPAAVFLAVMPLFAQIGGPGKLFMNLAGPLGPGGASAISGDGSTVVVAAQRDGDDPPGGVRVYTRADGVWAQQGPKLVGSGGVAYLTEYGPIFQSSAVAVSGDGNTAIVGGGWVNSSGFAWIFTRSAGVWTEQTRVQGSDGAGIAQGASVAISSDGNTAAISGWDNITGCCSAVPAVWVFTRSGGAWIQQGGRLSGTGAFENVGFGDCVNQVALSGDGNTLIMGSPCDDNRIGAAWVFVRTNGDWVQQSGKLVATSWIGHVGNFGFGPVQLGALQGFSVAISTDGNTAIIGGPGDNTDIAGAAWVFTRNNSSWCQQAKLSGGIANAEMGGSVALSGDGNIALTAEKATGFVWVWTLQGGRLVRGQRERPVAASSVGLSADGLTVLVNGGDAPGAWIFALTSSRAIKPRRNAAL